MVNESLQVAIAGLLVAAIITITITITITTTIIIVIAAPPPVLCLVLEHKYAHAENRRHVQRSPADDLSRSIGDVDHISILGLASLDPVLAQATRKTWGGGGESRGCR